MVEPTHRVILDTDIGTDVDDILALAVLLGSEEVRIEGVTTVYGDVELRTRMVAKMLKLRGVTSVPVYEGTVNPLLNLDPIYWPGHEGIGLLQDGEELTPSSPQHAVDFLIEHVRSNPGEITLLAVGPLTNVAMAILRDPLFVLNLKRLVIMGGRIATFEASGTTAEHNIKCDPEAAHVVFASGATIELVPLDVTLRAVIRQNGVEVLRSRNSPYHQALADQVSLYPPFAERGGSTFLHDPLAALAVLQPELLTWTPFHIEVELGGRLTRGMTVATTSKDGISNVSVAMDLDVAACEACILKQMAS